MRYDTHNLKCNNIKCLKNVKKMALVTICGHIYCYQCSNTVKKVMKCIACRGFLKEDDLSIKEIDKKPCLQGFTPDIILEESRKGINFWFYQIYEELEILKIFSERTNANLLKDHENLKNEYQKCKIESKFLEQKLKKADEELVRERQNIYDLQGIIEIKNKEIQDATSLNERLKFGIRNKDRKHINVRDKNLSDIELNDI